MTQRKKSSRLGWAVALWRDNRRRRQERTGPSAEAAHERRKASAQYDPEKSAKVGKQMLGGGSGG